MLEEAVSSSIWSSISSWFTPTFLFLLLNLVIGIIVVSSAFGSPKSKPLQQQQQHQQQESPIEFLQHHHQHQEQAPLARAPSVLERLKSINLYHLKPEDFNPFHINTNYFPPAEPVIITTTSATSSYETHNQTPLARAPSILERLKSINLNNFKPEDFNPFPTITSTFQQQAESITTHRRKQVSNPTQEQKRQQSRGKSSDEFLNHRALEKNKSRERINPVDDEFLNSLALTKKNSKSRERINPDDGDEFLDHHRAPNKNKSKASENTTNTTTTTNNNNPDNEFLEEDEEEEMDNYERRRTSTVKENKSKGKDKMHTVGDDEEVDAKADDFINRFKNQLKLQRHDSLMRYKDMLTGGPAK